MVFDLIMTVWWFSASQGVSLLVCIVMLSLPACQPKKAGVFRFIEGLHEDSL